MPRVRSKQGAVQTAKALGLNKLSFSRQVHTLGFGRDEQGRFPLSASAPAPHCRSISATPYPDVP